MSQQHRLLFLEPLTFHPSELIRWGQQYRPITVNDQMYRQILSGHKSIESRNRNGCEGNAYVFGELFNPEEYTLIGGHGNDAAGTGLIDYDQVLRLVANRPPAEVSRVDRQWREVLEENNTDDWEGVINNVRREFPEILFLGNTDGGDVGADLYAHRDQNGEIDSLIIENDCIFPREQEEPEQE